MAMAISNARQRLAEVNPDEKEKLFLRIYDHFDEQELIDVTFKLSNPTALVTAHRLILSSASPYFRELFKSEKGFCPVIEISEIDSDTFERLITFCYTGKTLITSDNVDEMLKAAIVLQLDDAVTNCVDFIFDRITDYTLQRAWILESETQNDILRQKILEYEIRNFMEIIQCPEFLNFDASKLQKIIESDDLNVKCEDDVYEAVKLWYEHDALGRKQQLPVLIGCLRLTQFDPNYIMSNIHSLPGCHFLALETVTWSSLPLARSKLTLKYTKPRKGQSEVAEEILALNLWGDPKTIYQYNTTKDSWQKLCDIKMENEAVRAIFMKENLIFIGGKRNGMPIDEVSSWNFKTKTFMRLPSMQQPQYWHSLVLLNDKIYAIGGAGMSNKALQSVETYSASNGWQTINQMNIARCGAGAVTLNGKIYVMGGRNGARLKSVERYDPITGCWIQLADMNEAHNCPGVTVHKGQIFVVGGFNGSNNSTVERYDEQRNEWTKIRCLSTDHASVGCIYISNQLWAIGGSDGYYNDNNCVFVYDDENDEWIEKSQMPSKGAYYCFTVPKALLGSAQQM